MANYYAGATDTAPAMRTYYYVTTYGDEIQRGSHYY